MRVLCGDMGITYRPPFALMRLIQLLVALGLNVLKCPAAHHGWPRPHTLPFQFASGLVCIFGRLAALSSETITFTFASLVLVITLFCAILRVPVFSHLNRRGLLLFACDNSATCLSSSGLEILRSER